ncbi:uncharacterized protein LOC110556689 [Meriones unguiculatus]|uniref:uncharacterized protein LOC110556689 n=1 Tax=Meriones unguiculatus TaxID=10047 RepID=UPI00293E842F|nr:uncharacterized protein LOC110556689 [Meriones unguiculatus]
MSTAGHRYCCHFSPNGCRSHRSASTTIAANLPPSLTPNLQLPLSPPPHLYLHHQYQQHQHHFFTLPVNPSVCPSSITIRSTELWHTSCMRRSDVDLLTAVSSSTLEHWPDLTAQNDVSEAGSKQPGKELSRESVSSSSNVSFSCVWRAHALLSPGTLEHSHDCEPQALHGASFSEDATQMYGPNSRWILPPKKMQTFRKLLLLHNLVLP